MRAAPRAAILALALLGTGGCAGGMVGLPGEPPAGVEDGAEALARSLEESVNVAAWARTGAVRWTFPGGRRHLWDRARNLERLRVGDTTVLLDLHTRRGRVFRGDAEVTGRKRDRWLERAWDAWVNDSFWLNPVAKIHDPGTERRLVRLDARQAGGGLGPRAGLLVTYTSGGNTPGDSYLWIPGDPAGEGPARPAAWRMWVSILPVGGLRVTWEDWVRLETGAWVSTLHRGLGVPLRLADVAGTADLAGLEPGSDPFAPLDPDPPPAG